MPEASPIFPSTAVVTPDRAPVMVIGAGPAGLMAADVLSAAGITVDVYDAMPSVGRKFLLAGKGGLNLTHSEPMPAFVARYGAGRAAVAEWLERCGPAAIRAWAEGLGIGTFVGSNGRVFPTEMKAAPLLRAWLHRLRERGVRFHTRHRWIGWGAGDGRRWRFQGREGTVEIEAGLCVLALGGASWPRLGSDGAWVPFLHEQGVGITPWRASNCGFDVGRSELQSRTAPSSRTATHVPDEATTPGSDGAESFAPDPSLLRGWSEHFRSRHAGAPLKTVSLRVDAAGHPVFERRGEFVVTETGIEGSLVYAASSFISDVIAAEGAAAVHVDLLPDRALAVVIDEVARPRGSRSLSTHLKSRLGLAGVKTALLHELLPPATLADPQQLGAAIKAVPLRLVAARPIEEAISSAGGVRLDALGPDLMLRSLPGVYCAGEMLDWDAPTGGYLLTACLASGVVAAQGVLERLGLQPVPP